MAEEIKKQEVKNPEPAKHPITQFIVGEELVIKDSRFIVHDIRGYRLYLDFLPSK